MSAVAMPARRSERAGPWRRALDATVRRVPRAGWACFIVALLSAATWSLLLPPLESPDESQHLAYIQYVAETGKAPPGGNSIQNSYFSPQVWTARQATYLDQLWAGTANRGVFTPEQQSAFRERMRQQGGPASQGGFTNVTVQPPLYYALEAIPYWLSPSHDILVRLTLIRLGSALMFAGMVLAIFLFLRELLPRARWAWCLGALAVAVQPQVASLGGAVNVDNLLFLVCASVFFMLARTYRRGLTVRRSVVIGLLVGAGLVTKTTFWGLAPGIALTVLIIGWRAWRGGGRLPPIASRIVLSGACALAPFLVYGLLNVTAWHRGSFLVIGLGSGVPSVSAGTIGLRETFSYIWDFYLPRLPFMHYHFIGGADARSVWIDGFIGRFGQWQYVFPGWVYTWGERVIYAIFWLAAIACARRWRQLREWLPLGIGFLAIMAGLVYEIGSAGVGWSVAGSQFEQARYIFPLLALYALMVALAPLALPRRWAPTLASVLLVLLMAHGLFAMTLTISRFYG